MAGVAAMRGGVLDSMRIEQAILRYAASFRSSAAKRFRVRV
jgi:hypothetical protein